MLQDIFQNKVEKYSFSNEKVVLAVSGGPDSMALLYIAKETLPKGNIIVAHLNHNIRRVSKREKKYLESLSCELGLVFETKTLSGEQSSEEALRRARYLFLRKVKQKYGAKYILTAHHAGDQVETVLLKLTRGAGPVKLFGIKELEGDVLRPFAGVSKEKLLGYVKNNKIKHFTDKTNTDIRFSRNRIRNRVVPELKKINPKLEETILRNSALTEEADEFMRAYTAKKAKKLILDGKIIIEKLKKELPYIQKEILRIWLSGFLGERQLTRDNIEKVLSLIFLSGRKEINLGSLKIVKDYQHLGLGRRVSKPEKVVELELGKRQTFGKFVIFASLGKAKAGKNNILLPRKYAYNLKVRSWKPGDRLKTASGTKKLQDIFSDAKITREDRARWPVLVTKNQILWVPRLAASAEAKKISNNDLVIEVFDEKK